LCLGLGFAFAFAESRKPIANFLPFVLCSPMLFAVPDNERNKNALLIAASLIAAVRTAREEKIERSPRIIYKVDESVRLAEMVLKRIEREG
jgi:hypothetical protein